MLTNVNFFMVMSMLKKLSVHIHVFHIILPFFFLMTGAALYSLGAAFGMHGDKHMTLLFGQIILLTRGDTLMRPFVIKNNGVIYEPAADDTITFKVKKDYSDKNAVLTKYIDPSDLTLILAPSDTAQLAFGDYYYDMQLTTANDEVFTFMSGVIRLLEET